MLWLIWTESVQDLVDFVSSLEACLRFVSSSSQGVCSVSCQPKKKKKKKCEQVFTFTNYYYYLSLYKRQVVLFQPPCSIKLPFSCTFRSFSFGIVIPFVCVVSNHIINLKSFNFRSIWFKLFQIAFNKLLLTKVMKSQVNCSQDYLSIERFVIVT